MTASPALPDRMLPHSATLAAGNAAGHSGNVAMLQWQASSATQARQTASLAASSMSLIGCLFWQLIKTSFTPAWSSFSLDVVANMGRYQLITPN